MITRNKRTLSTIIALISAMAVLPAVYGNAPTLILGGFGEEIIYSEGGSDSDSLENIGISGLFGWRNPLDSGGYVAINSKVTLNTLMLIEKELNDEEIVSIELALPAGMNRIKLKSAVQSSLLETDSATSYIRPDWELKYQLDRGRRKVKPYALYKGYYLYQDQDDQDSLYNGGEIGFDFRPSIMQGYKISAAGSWKHWLEYPLYDAVGSETGEKRDDYIFRLTGKTDGLLGYFADWSLKLKTGLILSNANRYLSTPSVLDEKSESKWIIASEYALGWSPNRQLNFEINPFVTWESYLERQALKQDGSLAGETLSVFTAGSRLHLDWTPDDILYFVMEGSGSRKFANDPDEELWNVVFRGGIELKF